MADKPTPKKPHLADDSSAQTSVRRKDAAAKKSSEDVAMVWGATPDGGTLGVLRKRGEQVEAAMMTKAEEGQPVSGELVRLKPREEPQLYDVEVLHDPKAPAKTHGRPAQVASESYRQGWDRLFKRSGAKRELN